MSAAEHSTFWLLYGQYGATMSFERFCAEFFPSLTHKAVRNRISAGTLPKPYNFVTLDDAIDSAMRAGEGEG